jgi:predicted membrane channel-forming protein YqfA (hemolysin III family)
MAESTMTETWKHHWDIVDRVFKFLGWVFALATVATLWWETRTESQFWLSMAMFLLLNWLVISPFWLAAQGSLNSATKLVHGIVAVVFLVGGPFLYLYQAPQSLTHGPGDETVMAGRGPAIHIFDI